MNVKIAAVALVISSALVGAGCRSTVPSTISPAPTSTGSVTSSAQVWKWEKATYDVDVTNSVMLWKGEKITGSAHSGTIKIKEGSFTVREEGDTPDVAGKMVIDMTSLVSDEKLPQLETHLKADDFFGVKTHPTAQFDTSFFAVTGDSAGTLSGTLTLKGTGKSITFPITWERVAENRVKVRGTTMIDRTEWGVKYGSGKFFSNLGDNLIKDTISLSFDVELIKK